MPTSTAHPVDSLAVPAPLTQASPTLQALAADAAHEARMHAVLVEVQQQLNEHTLSDADLFQRAAQAALEATGGEGASVELLQAQGLHLSLIHI